MYIFRPAWGVSQILLAYRRTERKFLGCSQNQSSIHWYDLSTNTQFVFVFMCVFCSHFNSWFLYLSILYVALFGCNYLPFDYGEWGVFMPQTGYCDFLMPIFFFFKYRERFMLEIYVVLFAIV